MLSQQAPPELPPASSSRLAWSSGAPWSLLCPFWERGRGSSPEPPYSCQPPMLTRFAWTEGVGQGTAGVP